MGFPAVGRPIFVFPLRSSDCLNMKNTIDHVCLHKCEDLYLALVPPKVASVISSASSMEPACITCENGMAASPKTPSVQTKLAPPGATSLKSHDFPSSTDSSACLDVSSVKLALADEKAKELLQASSARWLHGRCLLVGNIVTVPLIFGQICLFVVEGADKLLAGHSSQDLMSVEKDDLRSREIQVFNPGKRRTYLSWWRLKQQFISGKHRMIQTCLKRIILVRQQEIRKLLIYQD